MFRINRRIDYAIRVLLALAKLPAGTRRLTRDVQDEMLIPPAFLQRIIADLSKTGLLETYPGPKGGLKLGRPAGEITLGNIWEAIEGPLCISNCVLDKHSCPLGSRCPVRGKWSRMQALILQELQSTTLEQLAQEAQLISAQNEPEAIAPHDL